MTIYMFVSPFGCNGCYRGVYEVYILRRVGGSPGMVLGVPAARENEVITYCTPTLHPPKISPLFFPTYPIHILLIPIVIALYHAL